MYTDSSQNPHAAISGDLLIAVNVQVETVSVDAPHILFVPRNSKTLSQVPRSHGAFIQCSQDGTVRDQSRPVFRSAKTVPFGRMVNKRFFKRIQQWNWISRNRIRTGSKCPIHGLANMWNRRESAHGGNMLKAISGNVAT